MNIIFFGSDDFAAAHLKELVASAHEVVACVTQPDRPKGRGMKMTVSAVKGCAQDRQIPLIQPDDLKDAALIEKLKKYQADIFVVIAYGKFLPGAVRDMPSLGAVNVHASLLPKYRGAGPINWAVINGEKETGITIMKISEGMDAGDILASKTIPIRNDDTAVTLRSRMMEAGPLFLVETLEAIGQGRLRPKPQDHSKATMAPKLSKDLGAISWKKGAGQIHDLIRGAVPWPGAYTIYKGKLLKVLEAQVVQGGFDGRSPGEVTRIGKEGIIVAAGRQGLLIKKVHLQDGKPMDASAFVRGHEVNVGYKFEGLKEGRKK